MLTIETIEKCMARHIGYYNLGKGIANIGDVYQVIEEPRLQYVDSLTNKREWMLDGEAVGEGLDGLAFALAGLVKPAKILPLEDLALKFVNNQWESLRIVRDRIAVAIGMTIVGDELGHFRLRKTVTTGAVTVLLNELHTRAEDVLMSLNSKGLVDISKKFHDLDRSTNTNSWSPMIRLRQERQP